MCGPVSRKAGVHLRYFDMEKEELYGEDRLAAETRIRNLLWTVSGDYDLSCELDIDSESERDLSL